MTAVKEELTKLLDDYSQKIRNKVIDDVFKILIKYNVPFHAEANYEIFKLKEGELNDSRADQRDS